MQTFRTKLSQVESALEKAGVEGNELHLYPFGGHGYGMRQSGKAVSTWPNRAKEWMNAMGWVKK